MNEVWDLGHPTFPYLPVGNLWRGGRVLSLPAPWAALLRTLSAEDGAETAQGVSFLSVDCQALKSQEHGLGARHTPLSCDMWRAHLEAMLRLPGCFWGREDTDAQFGGTAQVSPHA